RLRILVVEDHEPTRRMLARLLKGLGHEVEPAADMRAALEADARGEFDLVISDIGLPDGSGYDFLRQVAQRHVVRAIALSGYGMDDDRRQSEEAGFIEHLTKPVDVQKLEAAIERVASAP